MIRIHWGVSMRRLTVAVAILACSNLLAASGECFKSGPPVPPIVVTPLASSAATDSLVLQRELPELRGPLRRSRVEERKIVAYSNAFLRSIKAEARRQASGGGNPSDTIIAPINFPEDDVLKTYMEYKQCTSERSWTAFRFNNVFIDSRGRQRKVIPEIPASTCQGIYKQGRRRSQVIEVSFSCGDLDSVSVGNWSKVK